ncbi:MAG: aminodeoxychorismate/anthranilate synthase component II [Bacteroidota bacterium]|nr:aminodeoxychorismate/anthranilate synthase component II [Bacteroidota bacterium]
MILIIDNYDSFTYNLVHLVAELTNDYRVIRNDECSLDQIIDLQPTKILISPGPGKPEDAGVTKQVIAELGQKTPILGVCLGHQAIGEVFGAKVVHAPSLMHGKTSIVKHYGSPLFNYIPEEFVATRYHSLVLSPESIPNSLEVTALTDDHTGTIVMGVRHKSYPIEGIQFHPESILTIVGPQMVKNWVMQ